VADLFLIDTSVWIRALRRPPNPAVMERVSGLVAAKAAATCGPIVQEVLGGTVTEAEFNRLDKNLRGVAYLPMSDEDWRTAARLMFHLRRHGRTIPGTDLCIAAIAQRCDTVLVHADRHYEEISSFTREHEAVLGGQVRTESLLGLV
jgi:predicted nucleic acid-binding protein